MEKVYQVTKIDSVSGVATCYCAETNEVVELYDPLFEMFDKFVITAGGVKILSREVQKQIREM